MAAVPLRRNRDFMLLQIGQLLSSFGSAMSTVAYPLLVLAVTGSAAKAGYVSATILVPLLAFGLPAGVVADRVDRKGVMIASDAVGAASLATLAAVVLAHETRFWIILVVAFMDSTAGVFYRAGQSGAFRGVVPSEQIPAASSLVMARRSAVGLTAPPVGGALFAVGRAFPFLADAISYAFSTAAALLMQTPFQEERTRERVTLRSEVSEGITFFFRIGFLRTTLSLVSLSNLTIAGMQLTVIVLAKRHGLSSAAIGGFVALIGATTLLGSMASPLLRRWLPMRTILLSEYWAALVYVLFLVWPNVYVLAGSLAAQAFWFPNTDAAVAAYQYALIPDRLLGRALAVSNTLRVAAAPLGPLAAGLLLGSVSPRLTVALLAGVTVVAAAVGTLSPSMRTAPPLGPARAAPDRA
ncbi:MAG TPA: MFS transporter [Gaiellaceae bacterium]|nr:MFS transporter [Gaiellaceae bacterium]